MREVNNQIFTPDMFEKIAYIWTRSSISMMDVRHQSIVQDQPLRHYTMPSSALVYAYGGSATVQMNPFAMQFGYVPKNPIGLLHLFNQMMHSWTRKTEMNRFHTKNTFYQSMVVEKLVN